MADWCERTAASRSRRCRARRMTRLRASPAVVRDRRQSARHHGPPAVGRGHVRDGDGRDRGGRRRGYRARLCRHRARPDGAAPRRRDYGAPLRAHTEKPFLVCWLPEPEAFGPCANCGRRACNVRRAGAHGEGRGGVGAVCEGGLPRRIRTCCPCATGGRVAARGRDRGASGEGVPGCGGDCNDARGAGGLGDRSCELRELVGISGRDEDRLAGHSAPDRDRGGAARVARGCGCARRV